MSSLTEPVPFLKLGCTTINRRATPSTHDLALYAVSLASARAFLFFVFAIYGHDHAPVRHYRRRSRSSSTRRSRTRSRAAPWTVRQEPSGEQGLFSGLRSYHKVKKTQPYTNVAHRRVGGRGAAATDPRGRASSSCTCWPRPKSPRGWTPSILDGKLFCRLLSPRRKVWRHHAADRDAALRTARHL